MEKEMKKGRHYVIGYAGESQDAIYSNHTWSFDDGMGGCRKMTFLQAKKHLKTLMTERADVTIFELKPVFTIKRRDLE